MHADCEVGGCQRGPGQYHERVTALDSHRNWNGQAGKELLTRTKRIPTRKVTATVSSSSATFVSQLMDSIRQFFARPMVALRGPYWMLAALAMMFVAAAVSRHDGVTSVYDEITYLDWVLSLPGNAIAQTGEPFSLQGRELFACQGVMYFGTTGPPCGSDYSNLLEFPQQGISTADAYTPLFFWPVWAFAKVVTLFGPDLVYGARLAMMMWLVPTVLVMFAVMRRMRVHDGISMATIALFISSPFAWWSYTYLSTDASVPLIGALALLIAVRFLQDAGSLWWLVPLAVVGQLLKVTSFLGILLPVIALALVWGAQLFVRKTGKSFASQSGGERTLTFSDWFLPALTSGIALAATQLGWTYVRQMLAVGEPPNQWLTLPRGMTGEMLFQSINFLWMGVVARPMQSYGNATWNVPTTYGMLLTFLVIAGVIGMLLSRPASTTEFGLAWATGIAAVTFGPLLFGVLLVLAEPFSMPGRYGAALLPAFFLMVALAVRWPGGRLLLVGASVPATAYALLRGLNYA